jgi:hypothetical protein
MNSNSAPTVAVDENGVSSVTVAPGVQFIWWIEKEGNKERLYFKIAAPSVLRKNYEQVVINERDDVISFPLLN